MTLVPRERLLLCDGRPVALTPKAFDLLVHFAGNPRRLLTKDELMSVVWPDVVVEESNLAHHVFAIRKALGEAADGEPVIETVPKQGYRFVAPVVVEDESAAVAVEAADMSDASPDTRPITASRGVRSWRLVASSFVAGALVMAGFDWLARRRVIPLRRFASRSSPGIVWDSRPMPVRGRQHRRPRSCSRQTMSTWPQQSRATTA